MSFYCVIVVLLSVGSLCWFICQYLPNDWPERLLWGYLFKSRRLSPQRPGRRALLCLFGLVYCFIVCVAASPTQYVSYAHGTIQPICAESPVKRQPSNQPVNQKSAPLILYDYGAV